MRFAFVSNIAPKGTCQIRAFADGARSADYACATQKVVIPLIQYYCVSILDFWYRALILSWVRTYVALSAGHAKSQREKVGERQEIVVPIRECDRYAWP